MLMFGYMIIDYNIVEMKEEKEVEVEGNKKVRLYFVCVCINIYVCYFSM